MISSMEQDSSVGKGASFQAWHSGYSWWPKFHLKDPCGGREPMVTVLTPHLCHCMYMPVNTIEKNKEIK